MKPSFICFFVISCIFLCSVGELRTSGQSSSEGTVADVVVYSPGLEKNLLGDSPYRPVTVYLPPGYHDNPCMYYPVVYLLHGYGELQGSGSYLKGGIYSMDIKNILDDLISQDIISPLIVVMPNSNNKYYGSFYTNSTTTGNWEDFIVDDVVNYVDRNFRTLPQRESRGIAGHSTGGYGTFKLAMRNPQVFHALYGLSSSIMVFEDVILGIQKESLRQAVISDPADFKTLDFGVQSKIANAAAFAPNPSTRYFAEFPVDSNGVVIDSIWQKWLKHDPYTMLPSHKDSLLQFHAIQFDCGESDEAGFFPSNVKFSEALDQLGIGHVFEGFEGGHSNKIGERIEQKVLPFFSDNLADTLTDPSFIPPIFYPQHHFEIDEHSRFIGRILLDTCYWVNDSANYAIIDGDTAEIFDINNTTKELLADPVKLDYEKQEYYGLSVKADYKNDTVDITDTISIFVKLRNINDNAPVFNDTIIECIDPSLPPNTVVYVVSAMDPDGDLVYCELLEGNIDNTFSYSKTSGYIRVANSDSLVFGKQFNLTFVAKELYGPHSDTGTVTIFVCPDGVLVTGSQNCLNIYPNPAKDKLNIEFPYGRSGNFDVEIISLTGRTVYRQRAHQGQIDVSGIKSGLYFLKVTVEARVYMGKILIHQ